MKTTTPGDPGTICMHKILTHKTLILYSRDLVAWKKLGWKLWISLTYFHWPLEKIYILNHFSLKLHQLPNYLSEYKDVAYQWMQNDARVLKSYICIISVYENREIYAKTTKTRHAKRKFDQQRGFRDPMNKHRMWHIILHHFLSDRSIETTTKHFKVRVRYWVVNKLKRSQTSQKIT